MQNTVYSPVEYTVFQAKEGSHISERRFVARRGTLCSSTRFGSFLYETRLFRLKETVFGSFESFFFYFTSDGARFNHNQKSNKTAILFLIYIQNKYRRTYRHAIHTK